LGVSLLWAACLIVLLAARAVSAQDAPASIDTEIVAQVRFTREQFVDLTNKMLEVADMLEQAEPETAQVLREAVSQARRAFIAEDMERVASLLTQGLISAAASNQEGVIDELRKILELLRSGVMDLQDRQQLLRQWQEQLERIGRLLEDQKRLEQQSRAKANQAEIKRQFEELNERVDGLIAEQEGLRDETAARNEQDFSKVVASLADLLDEVRGLQLTQQTITEAIGGIAVDKLPLLADIERKAAEQAKALAERAGELAEDEGTVGELRRLGSDPASLNQAGEKLMDAEKSMQEAAGAMEEPNSQQAGNRSQDASADLAEAERILADLLDATSCDSPAGRLADRQGELADKTGELADALQDLADKAGQAANGENIDAAGREMRRAAEDLRAQRKDDALDSQEEAIRQLKDEKYRLAQLRQRVMEQAEKELSQQGAEQKDLADRTRRTGEEMQGQQDSEPTPGADSVGKASAAMDSAAGAMSGESSEASDSEQAGQANSSQREAIEQLQRAREKLAEAIEQEREKLESEQLAKIDEQLQKALDSQRKISESTIKVYQAYDQETGVYDRPEQLKLTELADAEGGLSKDIARIRGMLEEEGSTVVFPVVLKQVQDDLDSAQRRLLSLQADQTTQAIQEDIEAALEEMISAIREELSDRRNRENEGGSPGDGSGGGGQLVPPIAELKMLRRLELQIAKQTKLLNGQLDTIRADEAADRHSRLAERQKQLEEMTAAMAASMDSGQPVLPQEEGDQP